MVEVTSEESSTLDVTNCQTDSSSYPSIYSPPSGNANAPAAIRVYVDSLIRLLLGLEVVEEDGALLGLLTPVLNHDARAVDDLASVTLTVEDA